MFYFTSKNTFFRNPIVDLNLTVHNILRYLCVFINYQFPNIQTTLQQMYAKGRLGLLNYLRDLYFHSADSSEKLSMTSFHNWFVDIGLFHCATPDQCRSVRGLCQS